jgi:hypothetical protein
MKKFRYFMQIAYSPNNALITVSCRLRGGCERLLQLELSQNTYMDESAPYKYRNDLARQVRPVLEHFMAVLVEWAWEHAEGRRRRVAYY